MNNIPTKLTQLLERIKLCKHKHFKPPITFFLAMLLFLYLSIIFTNKTGFYISSFSLLALISFDFIIFTLKSFISAVIYCIKNFRKIWDTLIAILILFLAFYVLSLISMLLSFQVITYFQITDPIKNSCFMPLLLFVFLALVFMLFSSFIFHLIFWKWYKYRSNWIYIFEQFLLTFLCSVTLVVFVGIIEPISKYAEIAFQYIYGIEKCKELLTMCSLSIKDIVLILGFGLFGLFLTFQLTSKYSHAAITKDISK